jgi:hypothetical protein
VPDRDRPGNKKAIPALEWLEIYSSFKLLLIQTLKADKDKGREFHI